MARSWSQRSCHTTRAATTAAFCSHVGECQFAAENFYTISTDTHIDYLVIFLRGAHKNATRTVHFESLFDHYVLIAGGDAARNHPGSATSGCRAGRGVLAVVKKHAGVQPGLGIDGLAGDKV